MSRATDTGTLVRAGRALAAEIECSDGVATAALLDIADRLEQYHRLSCLARELQGDPQAPNRQARLASVLQQLAGMA